MVQKNYEGGYNRLLEGPPCRGIWQEFLPDDLARANWQVAMEASLVQAMSPPSMEPAQIRDLARNCL
jgi:hypothetical protein